MRKCLGAILLLITAMTLQACAPKSQQDCGFVQNVYGERISWKREVPVKMYLDESVPDQYISAIVAAAQTWEKTAGRRLFEIQTKKIKAGAPEKNGYNVIYWMNAWEGNRASEQARTSVYWVGDQIKEADIRVNNRDFNFYWNTGSQMGVNIEALLLHELGHVLGLKHKDDGGSVMATYLSSGSNRVALASTDTVNLQCEY
ncbi:Matrixin [compost metagenome]